MQMFSESSLSDFRSEVVIFRYSTEKEAHVTVSYFGGSLERSLGEIL